MKLNTKQRSGPGSHKEAQRRVRLLLVCLVVLFFCFLPSGGQAAPDGKKVFAASGMVAFPEESAEEILLRAHAMNPDAMVLAVAGYRHGIGGFPKDHYLAGMWVRRLYDQQALEEFSFATLLLWEGRDVSGEVLGVRLANCEASGPVTAALFFKQAGIFDRDAMCAALERKKKADTDWQEAYQGALQEMAAKKAQAAVLDEMMRLLRNPMEKNAIKVALKNIREISPEALISHAAIGRKQGSDEEWRKKERLFALYSVIVEEMSDSFSEEVFRVLSGRLETVPDDVVLMIRNAHGGKPASIRRMSGLYAAGSGGFPKDSLLSFYWLRFGALLDDPASLLLLALEQYRRGDMPEAWAWAILAEESDFADEKHKNFARHMLQTIEKQAHQLEIEKGKQLVLQFLEESLERIPVAKPGLGKK